MGIYETRAVIDHPAIRGFGTNTWHFRTTGAGVPTDIEQLQEAQRVLKDFYDDLETILATGCVVRGDGEWRQVDEEGAVLIAGNWESVEAESTPPLPASQCIVVGWGTAGSGRDKRGRTFLSPICTFQLDEDGTPKASCLTQVRLVAQNLVDESLDFGDGAFVVWSDRPGEDAVAYDFTRRTVHDKFGSLRSRRD